MILWQTLAPYQIKVGLISRDRGVRLRILGPSQENKVALIRSSEVSGILSGSRYCELRSVATREAIAYRTGLALDPSKHKTFI